MFPEEEVFHRYDTRNKTPMRPIPDKKGCLKCIRYRMPEVIDNTDEIVTEKADTHSPKGFSNYAKNYFLNKYKSFCSIPNCYICES